VVGTCRKPVASNELDTAKIGMVYRFGGPFTCNDGAGVLISVDKLRALHFRKIDVNDRASFPAAIVLREGMQLAAAHDQAQGAGGCPSHPPQLRRPTRQK
jgi:hypothetical protein